MSWFRHASELRFGIVDAVAIRHERDGTYTYDTGPERERLRAALDAAGLQDLQQIHQELERYRLRRPRPHDGELR